VPKKTLQELVNSTRHSYATRIIINAFRVITNQTNELCDFIACIKKQNKDACISLSRQGRDPITSILVRNVWDQNEIIENFEKENKKIPEALQVFIEDEANIFYFCDCTMNIRNIKPQGPSR